MCIRDRLTGQDAVELQRSQLASRFGCAPSQINYVIETRFSPARGFSVESRRGGGGYIRIVRVPMGPSALLQHTVAALGEQVDQSGAQLLLHDLHLSLIHISSSVLPAPRLIIMDGTLVDT